MPCYGPMTAYFGQERHPKTGRRALVFDKRKSFSGVPIPIPCGKCYGCQLEWSRQWAMRCMHEKRMHVDSAFLTLTYRDKDLPARGSLVKRDLQLFMKRLRSHLNATGRLSRGLRFFACGEYGETTRRPHYHVLLFNACFPDMRFYSSGSSAGSDLFVSAELDGLWKKGDCKVGHVTFDSCAYVARYVTKKINGPAAPAHYYGRLKEFHVMSRRPGLGLDYYVRYAFEMYRHDAIVINGREVGIPRYYDTKFSAFDEQYVALLKRERRRRAALRVGDETNRRRVTIERFHILKSETFKRKAI